MKHVTTMYKKEFLEKLWYAYDNNYTFLVFIPAIGDYMALDLNSVRRTIPEISASDKTPSELEIAIDDKNKIVAFNDV